MATITRKGDAIETCGELPGTGTPAPEFSLVDTELEDRSLGEFSGKTVILNIFPSIDTPTCAKSVRQFNERASGMPNTRVLCVSADLPFALSRFCGAEGIDKVETASTYRSPQFGQDYGVYMAEGRLGGLLARAVVVVNENGKVIHSELVPEIAQEPDYDAVQAALGG